MHQNLQVKQKPDIHLVFTFTYYHLFPFAINLRLDYLQQIIRELMNVQQNSVRVTTGRVFQIALRGKRYYLQKGEWEILLAAK